MNCKDLQELLLAYANSELKETQKEYIKDHLDGCIKCRFLLEEYTKTREKLLSLRQIPENPELKEGIMSEIKSLNLSSGLRRFIRPLAIAVPVILILAVVLSLHIAGNLNGTSGIIARAYAASTGLESFSYVKEEYQQDNPDAELVHNYHAEIKYSSPDKYYLASESYTMDTNLTPSRTETIRIGDQVYTNYPFVLIKWDDTWFKDRILTEKFTLELLNLLTETETLDEVSINGTDCFHYIGQVDISKYIELQRPYLERSYYRLAKSLPYGQTDDLETYIEISNNRSRTQDMTFEFWIGKDDYLLRQAKLIYQTKEGEYSDWNEYRSIGILNYYDFNEGINIEAPLNENGEILEGWSTYIIEPLEIPTE